MLHPIFREHRAVRWAAGWALLTGLVLCALPLYGTIGPESALALALLLCPWAAALGAVFTLHARVHPRRTGALLAQALFVSWALLALPSLLLALNALRMKTCDPWQGLAFLALGPWAGVSLAAAVGVSIASLVQRPRLAIALAALVPIASIGRALYDFLSTPGIFAFGHFFGYFPGTFYDRRVEVPDAWLSHRLLSALIGLGLWAFLQASRRPRTGQLSLARAARHPILCALTSLLAIASARMVRASYELGHRTSSAFVTHKLGLIIEGPRCSAVTPRELPVAEATRLAEDCEFRIAQLERTLGVDERERVTAYFFRSPQEKRALMGAMRVYIAKPWRREVYLQLSEFPHPVLAHELAHVVARNASSGMFGVPGLLGGLIPEPTLVEGMAVALEPTARDELTSHQWAKAAHEAKLAPRLSDLLGPRFFGANQQLAYTLAGSFLRFVLDTRGAEALRGVYRAGEVERALKKPFAELEREWKAFLANQVALPPPAAALAKQRFERGGVFSQVCPHAIDRLEGELSAALSAGDLDRAITTCREVLSIDPRHTATRATLAGTLARDGQMRAAESELKALRDPPAAPSPTIARAEVAIGDAAFMRGDYASAENSYRRLLSEPQPEGELRQLEVKLLALAAGEPTRSLLGQLLIGRLGRSTDARAAMHLIQRLHPLRGDGLAYYLEARQLLQGARPDLALPLLRAATTRGLPTRRLRVEQLRMHALTAFETGLLEEAEASARELVELPDASPAEQLEARDFLERVAFRRDGALPKPE